MSTAPEYRDFDYERRFADVQRLEKAVHHFDQAVGRGMVAMKEIASAFEAVGAVLAEMTSANAAATQHMVSTVPTATTTGAGLDGTGQLSPSDAGASLTAMAAWESASMAGASVAPTAFVDDETAAQVHQLTVFFAGEARRLNEGQPFLLYNTGVHRDVVNRLLPVVEHLRAIDVVAKKRDEALARYQKHKALVEKKELQYAKKGKAFVDHAGYRKSAEKRDESWRAYVAVRAKFYEAYRLLMEVHGHTTAHIVHRYLTLNGDYLRELLCAVERVLPAMENIYPTNGEFGSLAPSILTAVSGPCRGPPTVPPPGERHNNYKEGRDNSGGNEICHLPVVRDDAGFAEPCLRRPGVEREARGRVPLPGAVEEGAGDGGRKFEFISSVETAPAARENPGRAPAAAGAFEDKDEVVMGGAPPDCCEDEDGDEGADEEPSKATAPSSVPSAGGGCARHSDPEKKVWD
ncbi:hypothetical protein DQ04_07531040 [Trypanosoma grayi]|uniref:hypothetical protein n=1 Tax=Trypanosoma grayi TaxID=71804 RepID=UPI0004F4B832|nr:hypothetical protein DQ04_07531040 [Trypanosoma grayi]KEG08285.1 hypothetical protein DQ04_07531040 [Trypanosoma grayi]